MPLGQGLPTGAIRGKEVVQKGRNAAMMPKIGNCEEKSVNPPLTATTEQEILPISVKYIKERGKGDVTCESVRRPDESSKAVFAIRTAGSQQPTC